MTSPRHQPKRKRRILKKLQAEPDFMKKIVLRTALLLIIVTAGLYFFFHYNLHTYFTDEEKAIRLINSFGPYSVLMLIGLQIAQVIVAPIPGEVTGFIGGYLYGPLWGTIYSTIGLTIGSWLAFLLARLLGLPFVEKAVSQEHIQKYDYFMEHQGSLVSFILFLLPGFPKDALCYIMGLSHIKISHFMLISTVGRLLGTILLSVAGSCSRNHNNKVLAIVLAVSAAAVALAFFYREKWIAILRERKKRRVMKKKIIAAVLVCLLFPSVKTVFSQPYAAAPVNPPAPVSPAFPFSLTFPVSPTVPFKPIAPRQPVSAPFATERYKGKTIMLLAYSIDNPRAGEAVKFMQDMYRMRGEYNVEVLGLNLNDNRTDEVVKFNQQQNATFPLLLEKTKAIAQGLNLIDDLSLYFYNKQGQLMSKLAAAHIPPQTNFSQALHMYVNRIIKIGFIPSDEPVLGDRPPVPFFEATALDNTTMNIKQLYKKKPVVLVVFSPSCPHCRDLLVFLTGLMAGKEFKDRFFLVGVSTLNQDSTAKFIQAQGYVFPVVLNTNNQISSLFPSFSGAVPMGYIIDRSGGISAQHTGFSDRKKNLYLMELRKLCGLPNKPLLDPKEYSGQNCCVICHEKEHIQWSLTGHPYAYKSLQRKGREEDPACVRCHVTGWEKPGGYAMNDKKNALILEGVQCEVCHGPGYEACSAFTGAKPQKKNSNAWKALCLSCHTERESLNFNFARRFPKVMHSTGPDIASMNREQRVKLLSEHKRKNDLFGNPASYIGAEACMKCHEQEYAQWSKTAHAAAANSPAAASVPPDKKYRFTTGSGSPGGYPAPGTEGVQCEACHGPGERHAKDPQKKGQDYIVGLGGSCDNCVVEQICRTCHGPDDDQNFTFEQYREAIRHKPKQ